MTDHHDPEALRALEALLPHRPPMLLLDRFVAGDPDHAVASLRVRADGPFFEAGRGLPAWALVEVFAQTAALIGGLKAAHDGVPVAQGFLLGTRRLDCPVSHVPEGVELTVEARTRFTDGAGMGAYHCRVTDEAWPVECVLTVYTPPASEADADDPGDAP